MTIRTTAMLALFALGTGTADVAFAQDEVTEGPSAAELARAKQLYMNGRDLFAEKLYNEAISAWREGYRLSRKPAFLHNMGLAYEELGFLEEAVEALNKYRAFARQDEVEELKKHIADLDERIASIDRGDGDPGMGGYERPKPGIEYLDDDDPEPIERGGMRPDKPPRVKPEGQPLPIVPLALVAGGGVAILAGLGVGSGALSAKKSAEAFCGDATGTMVCLADAQEPLARGQSMSAIADGLVIAGVVAAGVGVVLWLGPGKPTMVVGPTRVGFRCAF